MERTWKSLQVSRQHWVKSAKYSDELKRQIDDIYFDKKLRETKTPEEIYQMIISLEIDPCPICKHKLTLGSPSCPNMLPSGNQLPENPTDGQLKHYNHWLKNFHQGISNSISIKSCKDCKDLHCYARDETIDKVSFRGARCMRKFNLSEDKMEASRKVGSKTGGRNIMKAHRKHSGMKFCSKCGRQTHHLVGVGCLPCHNNSDVMRNATIKRNLESWKDPEYAKIIAANLGDLCKPNFQTKNAVRFYKGQHLETLCKQLLDGSENIKNYPGFSIRFGRVCYHGMDVLTDEGILLTGNLFAERNDVLYYFDINTGDYVHWEEWKRKFMSLNIDFHLPYGFEFIPTFRDQNSNDWSGARVAFEHHLVELEIGWFAYIKFYISHVGEIKPLVVGKSGSMLVNNNGSDLSFSENVDDGPARKFLYESGFQWCKTQIAVMKCENELEAYTAERKTMKELHVFGS